MSNKTRKRLWPVSLVMALAVVGIAAAFLVVTSSPSNTQAHDGATGSTHCDDIPAGLLQDIHDATYDHDCDTGPSATPTPTIPPTPTPNLGSGTKPPDTYVIEAPDFVDQRANDITRYDIVVEDEDGNEPRYDGENNMVRIRFTIHDEGNLALGQVGDIEGTCLPVGASLRDDQLQAMLNASANHTDLTERCVIVLNVVETDFFEIEATTVKHNTRLGISLTISDKTVALNETHTITFLNPRMLSDLRILRQCIVWGRIGTTGHLELDILPSTPGGVTTQNMPTHYVVVRDASGGSLATTAGSASTRDNALPGERMFTYADVNTTTGDAMYGLLTASFGGAVRDTVYQVDVFTVDTSGSINDHVRGHVRVGN